MKFCFLLSVFTPFLMLTGCSTEAAEKTVKLFHEKLDNNELDYICDNLLDDEALESTARSEWISLFESINEGSKVQNRKQQSGFSKKTSNGITTTALKYTFEKNDLLHYERIVLIDRGTGPNKIYYYALNTDEKIADSYLSGF